MVRVALIALSALAVSVSATVRNITDAGQRPHAILQEPAVNLQRCTTASPKCDNPKAVCLPLAGRCGAIDGYCVVSDEQFSCRSDVCGCDGRSYVTDCAAYSKGVGIAHHGFCPTTSFLAPEYPYVEGYGTIVPYGQPTAATLAEWKAAGVLGIVNIRSGSEAGFWPGEAEEAARLGMDYFHVPIAGAADLNVANARNVGAHVMLIRNRSGSNNLRLPVAVHCASSNRVGAIFAILVCRSSAPEHVEAALAVGRSLGLKDPGMTETVRNILSNL